MSVGGTSPRDFENNHDEAETREIAEKINAIAQEQFLISWRELMR